MLFTPSKAAFDLEESGTFCMNLMELTEDSWP